MMTCHEIDRLVTPFIDGECSAEERASVVVHLRECPSCRERVDAESSAKQMLHAHATVSRTRLRPRVFNLGRPIRPAYPALLTLFTVAAVGLLSLWLRPATVTAVGVIGDSHCQHEHRFSTRFNVSDRECTLGCVKGGAEFVLVTDTQIYRISDQLLPELQTLANRRVQVAGTIDGDRIVVVRLSAADGSDAPTRR
jgi:Putative zinc-finger